MSGGPDPGPAGGGAGDGGAAYDVEVLDGSGGGLPGVVPGALDALVRFLLARLAVPAGAGVCVRLVGEAEMADLHERWMGEPGPTDVLSWPGDEPPGDGPPGEGPPGGFWLGDLAVCPDVAARQGAEAGHGTAAELDLLVTHGVLHLLGHDHAGEAERAVMFGLQDRLRGEWAGRGPR